jgi:hypothetical protein
MRGFPSKMYRRRQGAVREALFVARIPDISASRPICYQLRAPSDTPSAMIGFYRRQKYGE